MSFYANARQCPTVRLCRAAPLFCRERSGRHQASARPVSPRSAAASRWAILSATCRRRSSSVRRRTHQSATASAPPTTATVSPSPTTAFRQFPNVLSILRTPSSRGENNMSVRARLGEMLTSQELSEGGRWVAVRVHCPMLMLRRRHGSTVGPWKAWTSSNERFNWRPNPGRWMRYGESLRAKAISMSNGI